MGGYGHMPHYLFIWILILLLQNDVQVQRQSNSTVPSRHMEFYKIKVLIKQTVAFCTSSQSRAMLSMLSFDN